MSTVLSLDIGTSSVSVLVVSMGTPRVLVSLTAPNQARSGKRAALRHEQDPLAIWDTVVSLLDHAMHVLNASYQLAEIDYIVVTGQMHGVMIVDSDLRPVTPLVTWRDRRSADSQAVRELNKRTNNRRLSGCLMRPGYGGGTLHCVLNDAGSPPTLGISGHIAISIVDFITAKLGGAVATSPSIAASWGLYDLGSADWNHGALECLGIPEKLLPDVAASGQPVGQLAPELAGRWLNCARAAICNGLGDNQASVAASAPFSEGACLFNVGTGAQVSVVTSDPRMSEQVEVRPYFDGFSILVGASGCGGWSYRYFGEFFQSVVLAMTGSLVDIDETLNCMNTLAAGAASDCDGLEVRTLFLGDGGERGQHGSIQKIDTRNLTPGNICRATVQSIVSELHEVYKDMNTTVTSISLAGNGVRNIPIMAEEVESALGIKPRPVSDHEEAALGAAFVVARVNDLLPQSKFGDELIPAEHFGIHRTHGS